MKLHEKRDISEYEDIINLPHHVSDTHPRMTMHGRAGQFAPFAALNGHKELIDDTAKDEESKFDDKNFYFDYTEEEI